MKSKEHSIWTVPKPIKNADPRYICVIGNSGVGKSTLVNRLANELFEPETVIAIDERDTHHPYLDRLFFEPNRYGFQLQLNFMIQRILIAQRWLDAGFNLVMERSHLEDVIFVSHLEKIGVITSEEKAVYMRMWETLLKRAPVPNLVVALSVPAHVSVERISKAEQLHERPCEFPNDETKNRWLESWAQLYEIRFEELVGQTHLYKNFLRVDYPIDIVAIIDLAKTFLQK